mmetsp:Transcript_24581/g.47863  ORF Transcript_24581/g.47863 Transcript_24581/m.47863 type:complete len:284 (-) Transcript_24581:128-979(-)
MPSPPQQVAPVAGARTENSTDPQPLLHDGEEPTLCQRKPKHHLTMIPEDLKPISYRFHIVLAGEKAKEFAQTAVESDFALEHMQRKERDHAHASRFSVGAGSNYSSHGDVSSMDSVNEDFFYCPSDESEAELARLRLSTCIGFSQSLPLSRDREVSRNLVVALLFWQVGPADKATKDAISDYRTRLAEICHTPAHCRPYTTLLAFGANHEQRTQLEDFVRMQKTIKVDGFFFEEDTEDCVVKAMKQVCASTIAHLSVTYASSSATKMASLRGTTSSSCGCAAM